MSVTKSNILLAIMKGAKPQVSKFLLMLEIAVSESKYQMDTCDKSRSFTSLNPGISRLEQKKSIEFLVKYHILVPFQKCCYYINPFFMYGIDEEEKQIVEKLVLKNIIKNNIKAINAG